MQGPSLDERAREVLRCLIQLHIATGEPVGSESLSRQLNRSLSPATLRNVMADLEKLGYLEHPHTSAGRMPTDEGYRFYVDGLISQPSLPAREAADIESQLRGAPPGRLMEGASQLLSRLSGQIGFTLGPEPGRSTFRHVDFVKLPGPRVLVVMVSRAGTVTNKVVELAEEWPQDDLQACANYLNTHFAGMPLGYIRGRLIELMREEKALYDALLQRVVTLGSRAFALDETRTSVYVDGTTNILDQPEFEDVERMKSLFKTFEQKSRLVAILNACLSAHGVRITIGHENPDPSLRDMSLVTASCSVDGESWGLGVIGSTRMEYARVIALVDSVARGVARALDEERA